jgi:hypothetical protein
MKSTVIFFAATIVFAWLGLALHNIAQGRQAAILEDITFQADLNRIRSNGLREEFDIVRSKVDAVKVHLHRDYEYSNRCVALEGLKVPGNSLQKPMTRPEKV